MIDITQSNRPLWHQSLTYGQVEAEAEKDYANVVYNLHEDCLCLCEELEALKQSIPKIKADAIRDAKDVAVFTYEDKDGAFGEGFEAAIDAYDTHLDQYANKIEDGS